MPTEAHRLANATRASIDLSNAKLSDEFYYSSLPLCVVDAVFSIGVRYESVQATVKRFCSTAGLTPYRQNGAPYPSPDAQMSVSHFLAFCGNCTADELAARVFINKQRTSTRSGILKAQAVCEFAQALADTGIQHFQDVVPFSDSKGLKQRIQSIKGQGSGISYAYFLMLAGDDGKIKPDRMLIAFAENALGRKCDIRELQRLYESACGILKNEYPNLTPRMLDYQIWNYQRSSQ